MLRFRKLRNFIIDVRNFIRVGSIIRKHRGTADWERFNLRVDYVNRIYTVFNPGPEDKGDDPQMLDLKMGERMIPCHKYIDSIGLGEMIAVSGEKIPDSDSYLIVYYPFFKYITTWRLFINAVILILLIIFRHSIIDLINWVISLF